MKSLRPIWPALLAAALANTATAQSKAPPSPLDAGAPAAPLAYDSAFTGYRAYQEPQPASWKETNAIIGQSPGHGAHGAPAAPAAPAPQPKADPHQGHHGHHGKDKKE